MANSGEDDVEKERLVLRMKSDQSEFRCKEDNCALAEVNVDGWEIAIERKETE